MLEQSFFIFKAKNLLVFIVLVFFFSCVAPELPESVALEYKKLPERIDFNQHVKPILSDRCFLCHGPDKAKIKAGLQLHISNLAYSELPESPGKVAIDPGNLKNSEVFHRIISEDPNYVMPEPESHLSLSDYEKAMLIKWIEDGAEYKDHWAFIKPQEYEVPKVENVNLAANSIDNFILDRLKKEKILPSAKADKEILLRRLSLDLTGLPPSLEDLDFFMRDTSINAYERQVDRLLNSSHYGEQMALGWMDLSRFADTHGYSVDRYRDMSPWRDWVIEAFNKNMPYNQFVTWQLAGDLIENATTEMNLATAFNRLHPQNMEGGIVNEEFLVEYAVDRVSTVGQAFMGLTVACARCHDHKYDPVSTKNFYELTSYFNSINESGQISFNNAMPVPTMLLYTDEEEKIKIYMEGLLEESHAEIKEIEKSEVTLDFKEWIRFQKYKGIQKRKPKGIVSYFDLNDESLVDALNPSKKATMKRDQKDLLTMGKFGKGIVFDGDSWLDLKETGVFGRNDKFSISVWANIPSEIEDGNIFHKGDGAILYNWRGYHLKINNNRLELMMAHTAPDNAIIKISKNGFPRDQWIHLGVTYDGSSKASGYRLFVNGKKAETAIKVDNLYKNILFGNETEPGLQLGARWRGKGIKGGVVDEVKVFNKELSTIEIMQLADNKDLSLILSKSNVQLTEKDKKLLKEYYIKVITKKTDKAYQKLAKLRKVYVDSAEKIQEVMVMRKTTEPVKTYVLERGVYDNKGEEVSPDTPEAILPMPDSYPKNRLGFAKWLFHKDHPLTARVAVNRYWQHYFGVGLVKTSEDFGNQGEMPSHPKLLDWLAISFRKSGWDVKELQKMIVMSNTYQQSSIVDKKTRENDTENRLLARGPSKRLTGEMLRDNALACSGLLNTEIGGESVKPYQPKDLWKVNGGEYKQDTGDKLYRRSMYTIWKRSVPYPTIATFDTPTRDVCTVRRQETNTPLQALVLLNDPTYIEAARVLGKKMLAYDSSKEGIAFIFRKLTGRKIKSEELEILSKFHKEEHEKFRINKLKTKGWMNSGASSIKTVDDEALVAANTVIVSTIMNSDATITKR
ncbi:DUF1553 domain-containing protein [Maribacter sp. HTCC2170]|uniref:DUF1553 domain-containing protein n=1 Tax=Maribacter sp. (strain HTCC2170 / KCCM 42371) TaxID=313603 RepID=UPI00006BD3FA|nr:DUF1553 domain-containing protein [Maribacter sp. HTCC2170]EAR02897.1 hypothetical protein FB2170_06400 [Maribacter sp. HTCC2170]